MRHLLGYVSSTCYLGRGSARNARLRRVVVCVLLVCSLLIATVRFFPPYRAVRQSPPPDYQKPAGPDEHKANEWKNAGFYNWETTSYFNPVSQDITNASTEQLCKSFPDHKLSLLVQPVLKLGHGENKARVEAQLSSVSVCIKDLLIFSDSEEQFGERQVYDILADLPTSYRINNPDFSHYVYMQQLRAKGELDNHTLQAENVPLNGWAIDRYKFLPMIERTWNLRPNKRFYLFYESDTYVVWDNVFRFLDNLDADTSLYIGSPSPGRYSSPGEQTWFANGGPGFILSRGALRKLLARKVGESGDYIESPLHYRWLDLLRTDACGDSVLGWALHHAGVQLSGFWPLFNPHALHSIPFSSKQWCQPVLTLHKTKPEDMVDLWRWEHGRRERDQPLLYKHLCERQRGGEVPVITDWDNRGWDEYRIDYVNSLPACTKACSEDAKCFQYHWHLDHCTLMRSIRTGSRREAKIEKEASTLPGGGREWTWGQSRFTSGWNVPRINEFKEQHKCEVVEWVRPSLTRVF